MKKIVYKSIFSIVIVLFAFLMLPNKQVKAQEEQTFPEVIMKVPYYYASWDNEYTFTYEFTIRYRLDNILFPLNDNLNEYDYFLIVKTGLPVQKGIPNVSISTPSYELEEIQIEDNYTIFVVRLIISKTTVSNQYGDPEYMFAFFENDSAFYIKYDVYQYGYNLGYNFGLEQSYWEGHQDGYEHGYLVGWGDGWDTGYVDGRTEGYLEGYAGGMMDGYNQGRDVGYSDGYNAGQSDGYNAGVVHGYNNGYYSGFEDGKNVGLEVGYDNGYDNGYDDGYDYGYNVGYNNANEKYMQGYNDGFIAGEKSKIAQNNEAFYKSIEKWLVPAIITVIVLGGIVSITAIKRREQ